MKLSIIVDSSSGLTEKQAKERNWDFLPLYINVDGQEYADGIDIDSKTYYEKISLESNVRTSATPPSLSMDIIEKASKENDYVIVYALSNGLSSQTSNISMICKKMSNVFVVQSLNVGYAIVRDLEEIENISKMGYSWDEIKSRINEMTNNIYGVVAPETMKWLVKGGRASSTAAGMANLLKVVPLISFEKGKLDKYGKGRVFKKAIIKFVKELHNKFGDSAEYIIYNANSNKIDEIAYSIREILGADVVVADFPSVIVNHIGPGAIAVIVRIK